MIERMEIEEENADKVYDGLVLGPNKPEPVAAVPTQTAPETSAMGETALPSK
jgi:hypothetical protein